MTSTGTHNRQHKEGHISLLELKLHPRFTRNAMHRELQFWWVELHLAVIKESLKAECQRIWAFVQQSSFARTQSGTVLLCCMCDWLLEGPMKQSMNKTVLHITQIYFYLWRMCQEHEPELCEALHPSCLSQPSSLLRIHNTRSTAMMFIYIHK